MRAEVELYQPITHGGPDRRYRECRCSRCGLVATCKPMSDFYTRTKDGSTGPLYCLSCLLADDSENRR
jgi:hypothetical protein